MDSGFNILNQNCYSPRVKLWHIPTLVQRVPSSSSPRSSNQRPSPGLHERLAPLTSSAVSESISFIVAALIHRGIVDWPRLSRYSRRISRTLPSTLRGIWSNCPCSVRWGHDDNRNKTIDCPKQWFISPMS
jgi:hypothetical protein